jgi:hypothetical protein
MLDIQFVVGLIIGVVIFLGGIHFYGKYATISKSSKCPNILMKVDSKYYLYNSKLDRVPGVNPIEFDTLEDYTNFLKWQKTVGIKCPVLHVEKIYDAQGNRVFKLRPSATDTKGGLPPAPPPYVSSKKSFMDIISNAMNPTSTSPTCGKSSEEVDGHSRNLLSQLWANLNEIPTKLTDAPELNPIMDRNEYVNKVNYPPELLPCPEQEFKELSDDPMDVNWGGEDYTEKSIKAGKYAGSEISSSRLLH